MSSVGSNIKLRRERRGMTQQELAWKVGLGTKTIEKYESGNMLPDLITVLKISTVLDAPVSELQPPNEFSAGKLVNDFEKLIRKIGASNTKLLLKRALELADEAEPRQVLLEDTVKSIYRL